MSSGIVDTGAMGIQVVVGTGEGVCGGYVYGSLGGEMDRGGGEDGRDGDKDGQLIRWECNVANVILGMEPNAPLAYALVLELCHPIMSMLGGHGCRL